MSKTLSEKIHFALCCISECCVDESKRNITSRKAVEQIREYLSVITDDDRYSKNFNISLKREILQKDQRIVELEKEINQLKHDLAVRDKALRLLANETNLCHENGIDGIISCYLAQAEKELKGGEDEQRRTN